MDHTRPRRYSYMHHICAHCASVICIAYFAPALASQAPVFVCGGSSQGGDSETSSSLSTSSPHFRDGPVQRRGVQKGQKEDFQCQSAHRRCQPRHLRGLRKVEGRRSLRRGWQRRVEVQMEQRSVGQPPSLGEHPTTPAPATAVVKKKKQKKKKERG